MSLKRAAYLAFILLYLPALGFAEEGVVLGIRPEGVIADVGGLPEIQPGMRLGFVRVERGRRETGQGWVLDVKESRALVGMTPGSAIEAGDRVIVCPTPGQGDPYQELRTRVDELRASGVMGAQPRPTIGQVELALEARDAAIRQGLCDTFEYDAQLLALARDVEMMSQRLPPAAAAPAVAPRDAEPLGRDFQQPTTPDAPPLNTFVEATSKLAELAQTIRGMFSGSSGAAPGLAPPPLSGSPVEPSFPIGGSDFIAPPFSALEPVNPSLPPLFGGADPTTPAPPSATQIATVRGKVLGTRGGPISGASVTAVEWSQTMATAPDGTYYLQGPPGTVTLKANAPGHQEVTLMTAVAPSAASTRNLFLRSTKPEDDKQPKGPLTSSPWLRDLPKAAPAPAPERPVTSRWWEIPPRSVSPGTTTPSEAGERIDSAPKGLALIPKLGRPGTLSGRVLSPSSQPIVGARVTVGGIGSAVTDAQGKFVMRNMKPGQYQVTATSSGYRTESRQLTLAEGEIERVEFTLQRGALTPLPRPTLRGITERERTP